MPLLVERNASSVIAPIRILDNAGDPVTGLAHDTAGLIVQYRRSNQATWQTITLVAGTAGTWVSSGWVEDGSGWYDLSLPDAAIQSGGITRLRVKAGLNAYRYGMVVAATKLDTAERAEISAEIVAAVRPVTNSFTATVSNGSTINIVQRDDYENDDDILPIGPLRCVTTLDLLREVDPPTLIFTAKQSLGRRYGTNTITGTAYAVAVEGEDDTYDLYGEVTNDELDKPSGEYGFQIKAVFDDEDRSTILGGILNLEESMDNPPA